MVGLVRLGSRGERLITGILSRAAALCLQDAERQWNLSASETGRGPGCRLSPGLSYVKEP